MLAPPAWTPPGVEPATWRRALADDAVDLLAMLAEVEPALAVAEPDRPLAAAVAWPSMRVYVLPTLTIGNVLAAAASDGYEQAAVLAGDAPDLPGMMIAKLLRPLTTRPAAAAPRCRGRRAGFWASRAGCRRRLGCPGSTSTTRPWRPYAVPPRPRPTSSVRPGGTVSVRRRRSNGSTRRWMAGRRRARSSAAAVRPPVRPRLAAFR